MFSSSTISNINGALVDGAGQALVAYKSIFLLMGGIVLAFVIMEYILVMVNGGRDTIESNRNDE